MNNRDLIRQYVDTGLGIPQYQFNQLSGADKNTYIRKRLIAHNHNNFLKEFEFNHLDVSLKNMILNNAIANRSSYFVYISEHYLNLNTLTFIFDFICKKYKGLGIPDFVLSPILNTDIEEKVIKKITQPDYLEFLSPMLISKVVNSMELSDNHKNSLIKYFLNHEDIRPLTNQNKFNFIYNTSDIRIIDKIMTDVFISNFFDVIITRLTLKNAAKKAYHIALKIMKFDDEYQQLSINQRNELIRVINKLKNE